MTRGVGGHSASNVQKHLAGVDYPATKDDLVKAAKQNGAGNDILQAIEQFDREEYGGPQDVMKAYGEVE